MNHYQREFNRIKKVCFANSGQVQVAIDLKQYIDQNFDTDVTLELFSKVVFTSRFHLVRVFKRYYGFTPVQYLIDKRLQKARALLSQGIPVTETCFAVGFDSPSSFSTLFRNRMGMSPLQFQKRNFHKVIPIAASQLGTEINQ